MYRRMMDGYSWALTLGRFVTPRAELNDNGMALTLLLCLEG